MRAAEALSQDTDDDAAAEADTQPNNSSRSARVSRVAHQWLEETLAARINSSAAASHSAPRCEISEMPADPSPQR